MKYTSYLITRAAPYVEQLSRHETVGQAMHRAWGWALTVGGITIWECEHDGGSSVNTAIIQGAVVNNQMTFAYFDRKREPWHR